MTFADDEAADKAADEGTTVGDLHCSCVVDEALLSSSSPALTKKKASGKKPQNIETGVLIEEYQLTDPSFK